VPPRANIGRLLWSISFAGCVMIGAGLFRSHSAPAMIRRWQGRPKGWKTFPAWLASFEPVACPHDGKQIERHARIAFRWLARPSSPRHGPQTAGGGFLALAGADIGLIPPRKLAISIG
jgi:hypothetical protein